MLRSTTFALLLLSVLMMIGACDQDSSNPSATVKAYASAARQKDVEMMKRFLSKGSLEMLEMVAQIKRTTTDALLLNEAVVTPSVIDTRELKIDGDHATVGIFNEVTKEYDIHMPLIREDGKWKLARDLYTKQSLKK